jgi:hypothetical protein
VTAPATWVLVQGLEVVQALLAQARAPALVLVLLAGMLGVPPAAAARLRVEEMLSPHWAKIRRALRCSARPQHPMVSMWTKTAWQLSKASGM